MLKSLISKGLSVPHRCENRYILQVKIANIFCGLLTERCPALYDTVNPEKGLKHQIISIICVYYVCELLLTPKYGNNFLTNNLSERSRSGIRDPE